MSHHPDDDLAAEEIASRLRDEHDTRVWLRAWSVVPGTVTQKATEAGLAESNACAVLIGPAGVAGWQELDVYASIQKRVDEERSNFPVIPVYLPDAPSDIEAAVPLRLRLYEPVRFAGLDDPEALRRLVCGIQGEPPGTQEPDEIPCPYPGLEPFTEELAPYFFGREEEVQHLQEMLGHSPFVLVMGPSGSGKSSVVRAGLIPRLQETEGHRSPYLVRTLKPGREPLQSLAMVFAPQPGDPRRGHLVSEFVAGERGLARAIQGELRHAPSHVKRMILVVDQFEETFTQCQDAKQQEVFIDNVLYACLEGDEVQVVFTLRSDFFTPCFDYAALVDSRRHLSVPRLRGQRLRHAIEDSARAAGLFFQRGLVNAILDDAGEEPGILPLIAYTLRELFERRNGRWLTTDAYYDLGSEVDPELYGVRGVISARAEETLNELRARTRFGPEQVESIARRILLRLVQVSENSPPTRQQVTYSDFFWASDTQGQRGLLEEGLRLLIQERLLTADGDRINLAHEIIIKAWKRLQTWVNESLEGLLIRRRVEEAAREWDRSGCDESLLLRGVQLQRALEWQQRRI